MRRIGNGLALVLVVTMVAACGSLPRASEIEQARTWVMELRFERPDDGLITARAHLNIHSRSAVNTKIDEIHATLSHGTTKLGTAYHGREGLAPSETERIYLYFKDISVPALEAAIGRKLSTHGAEEYTIDGVIIYRSADGPVKHTIEKISISAILGPKGTSL